MHLVPVLGGNLGLFLGFSLVIFVELLQLIIALLVRFALGAEPEAWKRAPILQRYLQAIVLHGFQYIALSR